ncbi:MAG: peptide chain release factor N(5)-glutamine methyltransferase [Litorimonas sp.]
MSAPRRPTSPHLSPYAGLTVRVAKRTMAQQFDEAGVPFADEDALDLILGLTGLTHTDYVMTGTDVLSPSQSEAISAATAQRLDGTPVDRILGWREFYGRRFAIDNVLSPRGDTEVLLLAALTAIQDIAAPSLIDLGTGSGALAVSLLCDRPDATALATDCDTDALRTARNNAAAHNVTDRLTLLQSDWFNAVPTTPVDAVLSNPPYITTRAMAALDREVSAHDPDGALHGGTDGLNPYRTIIPGARAFLRPEGWLGVEIGFDQGKAVSDLFRTSGYRNIRLIPDPAGLDRAVCGNV